MRAAKGVMMDQKMEWHRATQMRATKSDPKLATQSTAMWLKAKQRIRHKRSFRRSNRAVRIVKGSPTGRNSEVLKTKAAKARPRIGSQDVTSRRCADAVCMAKTSALSGS